MHIGLGGKKKKSRLVSTWFSTGGVKKRGGLKNKQDYQTNEKGKREGCVSSTVILRRAAVPRKKKRMRAARTLF